MTNRVFLFLLITFLRTESSFAQDKFQLAIKQKDKLFLRQRDRPRIYLLGTFHLAGEKVDSNTTQFKWQYKVAEPGRQKELEVVRQKLTAIKPTVICVEFPPERQRELDSAYHAYCKGEWVNIYGFERDGEIVQLAAAVGKRTGVKQLIAVDARAAQPLSDNKLYEEYLKYAPKEDSLFKYWNTSYQKKSALEDSLRHHWTTLDFLRLINNDQFDDKVLGRWLITTRHGTNTNPIGADQFITRYFSRNARIYSNIQRAIEQHTDRVLVIFGNTHLSMLRPLFSSSPMYELVPAEIFLR